LQLENITGTGMPGNYNVYVDFPEDERPPAWIGLLSTFGIERASRADPAHPGSGLSTAFDITELAADMGITEGNVARLKIDFERIVEPETYDDLPDDLADVAPALNQQVSAKVGRVSLYIE
jgi:tyrosinase